MEIRYTLTLDDLVAFSIHQGRKGTPGWIPYLLGWVIPPLLAALALALLLRKEADPNPVQLVFLGSLMAGYPLAYPFVVRRLRVVSVRDYLAHHDTSGTTGEIRLTFTEEGLVEVTAAARSEARWADMKGVEDVGHAT